MEKYIVFVDEYNIQVHLSLGLRTFFLCVSLPLLALTNGLSLQVDGKEVLKFAAAYGFRNIQVSPALGVHLMNHSQHEEPLDLKKVGFCQPEISV